jgi:hypothetical protein
LGRKTRKCAKCGYKEGFPGWIGSKELITEENITAAARKMVEGAK